MMNGHFLVVHVMTEVMILCIDVLGSWSILAYGGNLDCTTIIFEDVAMKSWGSAPNRKNHVS
jgi:hypothetical protein